MKYINKISNHIYIFRKLVVSANSVSSSLNLNQFISVCPDNKMSDLSGCYSYQLVHSFKSAIMSELVV